MKFFFYSIIFVLLLSSCVSRIDKCGYMFDLSDHEALQESVTTQVKLLKIMGSPTLIADLDDDETWIYFHEDIKNFLFFKPQVSSREVITVKFDNLKTIKEIKHFNLSDEDDELDFVSNHTSVEGHKTGFFKSFFSNVGQIKPQ